VSSTTPEVDRPASAASITEVTTSPRRTSVPTILQQAQVECGAASLAMVLAHYGRWESLQTMRDACGVSRDGASAIALARAAAAFGLDYQGHRGTTEDLDKITTPAIIWWRRSHFMVLEGAHGGRFYVNDPARGPYSMPAEEFAQQYSGVVITFSRTDRFNPAGHRFRAWPSLWSRLRNSRVGVSYAVIAGVIAMLLGILLAPISQLFIDRGLDGGRRDLVAELATVLLILGLVRGGLTLLEYGVIARIQAKVDLVGTTSFIERLVRLPIAFHLQRAPGDLSQRVQYNAQIASLLGSQMASAGIALLAAVVYAGLLIYYNWILALVVVILSALNVVFLRLVMKRRTNAQNRVVRHQNQLRGTTASSIGTIESIKSTGMESNTFAVLTGQQAGYISATASLAPSSALLAAVPVLLLALTNAAILVIGGLLVIQGQITLGALLAVSALSTSLNAPVQTLMSTGSQLQVITASLNALDDILANDLAPRFDRPALGPGERVEDFTGAVAVRDLTFTYGADDPLVVRGLSLEIAPGDRVALVGGSGAGKTTVANLVAGLYGPTTGEVLYDGRPLADYPLGVLERGVAKVDQSVVLMQGTVRQNVTLWDDTVPEEDLVAALADAQILRDVVAREGGLDADVLEYGRNFSGGQAQRLEIARALVRNPRLLILDEATSALDDITEVLVTQALQRRGISCLIVAHRLSTIRDADEIIVLGRGGVILERGDHDSLMRQDGPYTQMVRDAGEGGDVGT
jgi:NHLM bacteriocin system ABC transporter peptidase/ATP-binding protein